jgi:hypothetical protein
MLNSLKVFFFILFFVFVFKVEYISQHDFKHAFLVDWWLQLNKNLNS